MNVTVIYKDRDYFGDYFEFECVVDEADHKVMIEAAHDEFHSSDFYTEWADQYTAEEMGDLDEYRFEIFATIINADGVYID